MTCHVPKRQRSLVVDARSLFYRRELLVRTHRTASYVLFYGVRQNLEIFLITSPRYRIFLPTTMRKLLRLSLRAVVGTVLVGPPTTTSAFSTRLPIAIGRTRQVSRRASVSSSPAALSSLIGDMAASLLGGGGKSPVNNPALDIQLQQMGPSWDTLRSQLESQQTETERQFRANLTKGYGVGSPLHKIRLFDESNKEEDIRVTFYRYVLYCRCCCCHKSRRSAHSLLMLLIRKHPGSKSTVVQRLGLLVPLLPKGKSWG